MTKVLIVYTSTFGNTKKMAEAVAVGAASVPDTQAELKVAEATTIDDLRACDALIVGSPVRQRSADSRVKQFIDTVCEPLWIGDEMVGKVGAVFTVGGGYGNCGAGCELAQLGLLGNLAALGMILITLPKSTPGWAVAGLHWGPNGRSGGLGMEPTGVQDEMLEAAWHHGANVARVTAALQGQDLFARGNIAPTQEVLAMFQASAPQK